MSRIAVAILLALLLAGCAAKAPGVPYRHAPDVEGIKGIVLCADVADALPYWQAEARRHGIDNAVIVVCHGTSFYGVWMAVPDPPMKMMAVEQLLWTVRREHPGRPIIAVICNPGGAACTVPDVFFARENVWVVPGDRFRLTRKGMDYSSGCLDAFSCTRIKGCNPHF
jgi:hypothetical protein